MSAATTFIAGAAFGAACAGGLVYYYVGYVLWRRAVEGWYRIRGKEICPYHSEVFPDICDRFEIFCPPDHNCPATLGDVGAWRSVIDEVRELEAHYFRMLAEDWEDEECIKDEELFYVSCDAQYLVQAAGCTAVRWTVV